MIVCQQRDIFKIRDKIPGHGPQPVVCKFIHNGFEYVRLKCKCSIPVSWLPRKEKPEALVAPKCGKRSSINWLKEKL